MPGGRRQPSSHLGKPVGRTRAQFYPSVRVYLQTRPRGDLRRRQIHSRYTRPIGRAVARTYAYPPKVYLAVKRQIPRLRYVTHSKLRLGKRNIVAATGKTWPIHVFLRIEERARLSRRRNIHSIVRRPIGRAVARTYAYPVRVYLQAKPRAAMPQRRRVKSLRTSPIGRAIARAVAYPIKVVLASIGRGWRRRFATHVRLGRSGGVASITRQVSASFSVVSRHTTMLLRSRFTTLTLPSRKTSVLVRTRQTSLTVATRKTSITVRSR